MRHSFLLFITLFFTMCADKQHNILDAYSVEGRQDSHSFAVPSTAITTHLSLELEADFDLKTLSGVARFDIIHNDAKHIVLDTKGLNIEKVTLNGEAKTDYILMKEDAIKGQALHVAIKEDTKKISVYYSTQPTAEAVQWLDPIQTADKKHPFLFTQGQAILTRTWIPCQDSPGIRITYDATIKVPNELIAVMSASNVTKKNNDGVYHFIMKQAIPPYLIALAIGDLQYTDIGPRTGVYAEASLLDKSAFEFSDMEKMLVVAEELYGPYLWERYDVIVLPPSFPFGGMENPRLTFATPTIIAGDKSLTSLIAHELAHSWSGNLVTNATWNDFWLNEGFTVYFERRIMEALYGEDYTKMLSLLGYQDMLHTVEDLGSLNADTHLHLNLENRNPDDGMTDIAYEKGAYFLTSIERVVGKDKFDVFLKNYFDHHKFKSISTNEFIIYLNKNLLEPENIEVNYKDWIFAPGIPDNCPIIKSNRFDRVEKDLTVFIESDQLPSIDVFTNWTTHEWLHFIRKMPADMSSSKMMNLDSTFGFSESGNSEIAAAWYELSINNGYYKQNLTQIEAFLTEVGRRKFLTPLYRALKESGDLETARDIYSKAKPNYHAVSTQTMDALLFE